MTTDTRKPQVGDEVAFTRRSGNVAKGGDKPATMTGIVRKVGTVRAAVEVFSCNGRPHYEPCRYVRLEDVLGAPDAQ